MAYNMLHKQLLSDTIPFLFLPLLWKNMSGIWLLSIWNKRTFSSVPIRSIFSCIIIMLLLFVPLCFRCFLWMTKEKDMLKITFHLRDWEILLGRNLIWNQMNFKNKVRKEKNESTLLMCQKFREKNLHIIKSLF